MTNRKPSILFHRHTAWQSAIRCSTNIYASLFMQSGFNIAYMQGIVHSGHVLTHRGQWRSWAEGPRRERDGWVFTPFSIVPYARRWPFNTAGAAHLSYLSCAPNISTLLRRGGMGAPDLIWSANPGSIALRRLFPRARFVFQVVDYYPAFSGDAVKPIERADYRGADHVFVIGHALRRYLIDEHGVEPAKITVLGQGVFAEEYQKDWPVPPELETLPRPIGIWVGVLDKCDPDLFGAAAVALRERGGTLVLIGPRADWAEQLAGRSNNVRVLGPRSPDQVPAFLARSDLALMLYDQRRQGKYRGQNPLKLYEFAAAGLPIVSTPHDEYEFLNPPVIVVATPNQVAVAVESALHGRENLKHRAREFTAIHGWAQAFERARDQIERLISH
jgi:glycosyltransferase involved in cell wall biosynthesis